MLVPEEVSQLSIDRLKDWALENISSKFNTDDRFQLPIGWSKFAANLNMPDVSVACDRSHAEMSSLNVFLLSQELVH